MNRYLLLAIAALIAVGAWLAWPSGAVLRSDEPLILDAPPAQVSGMLHTLQLQDAFRRVPVAGKFEDFAQGLTPKSDKSEPRSEVVSLWRGDSKILVIRIALSRSGSGTAVDVAAELPSSPLTRTGGLRKEDLAALAMLADLAITDYIAATLQPRAPAESGALRDALDAEAGFSAAEHAAFAKRVSNAVAEAFAPPPTQGPGDSVPGDEESAEVSADDAVLYPDGPTEPLPDSPVGEEPRPEDPAPNTSDE